MCVLPKGARTLCKWLMVNGLLFLEFDAAPVVDRVVADVGEAGVLSHSYDHRHILYIEAADKEQTVLSEAEGVGRDILEEDVAVDVCEDDVVGVALEKGSVAAACLDACSYLVEAGVVIG